MTRILLVGSYQAPSGLARVTRGIARSLEGAADVHVLGLDRRHVDVSPPEAAGGHVVHANPDPPQQADVAATLEALDALSDAELLDFTTLARVFGYPPTVEAQDSAVSARGYRAMAGIPRLQFAHVDLLVRNFGSLQGLLAATATDLQSVDGIGAMWARHVREGLSQLAESIIADQISG